LMAESRAMTRAIFRHRSPHRAVPWPASHATLRFTSRAAGRIPKTA
jgi:hypothetical protein